MRSTDIETNSKPEAKERSIAYKLADKQQEISVAEFFEKNKQILGFDSRSKSLLMGVKEAVDNSLDACEEAELLPEISVKIERLEDDEYRITVEDNGPGIVHNSMANVYGRLLYGSRFHALKQSRGQQGIGISATVMYGYLTTGKPAHVISKISGEDEVAWEMDVVVDTKNNRPLKTNDKAFTWDRDHGTSVEFTIKGRYITGKQSIFEYLKNTAIVNPHASITFQDPDGKKWTFEKATEIVPIKPKEIKPHPEGMEIGDLIKYAHASKQKNVESFLRQDFSRVTKRIADEILEISEIRPKLSPGKLTRNNCADLIKAIGKVKIMAPQTDCLSPIGDTLIKKGLMHVMDGLRPDYYATPVTRAPKTANGNPFVVEAGIVYGGDIPSESQINILRFANRVPLLYQQGACAITKAISDMDWRRYGLEQRGGKGIPYGPAIILVHVASTKVPFTSEGKEAIASYPEIINEVTAALRLCARNLKSHLNKIERRSKTHAKFEIVQEILPELAKKTSEYLNRPVPNLDRTITKIMNVVWIEPTLEKLGKNDRRCTYTIYNYTNSVRNFGLHAHVPKESVNLALFTDPCFRELDDTGRAFWEIKDLQPSTSTVITFELNGEMADTFSNEDIYISGINPTIIMGADALPGDWGIKGIEITEEEDIVEDDIPEDEEEETLEDEEFEKEAGK
ncbi:MAG TPA: DNA topoisomerase VI subunit B [Candidatus Methanomethylophilaceae archaeon]|nr:DNA topoisomerase VI subunit B [Candidatus Methanomethylophilaceae archaeon]